VVRVRPFARTFGVVRFWFRTGSGLRTSHCLFFKWSIPGQYHGNPANSLVKILTRGSRSLICCPPPLPRYSISPIHRFILHEFVSLYMCFKIPNRLASATDMVRARVGLVQKVWINSAGYWCWCRILILILIQTLLPLLEISPHCATHCTLHNTIAPTLFWLADTLLNYIFTSVWTKIYDYVIW
jgi:hypothetical protein